VAGSLRFEMIGGCDFPGVRSGRFVGRCERNAVLFVLVSAYSIRIFSRVDAEAISTESEKQAKTGKD